MKFLMYVDHFLDAKLQFPAEWTDNSHILMLSLSLSLRKGYIQQILLRQHGRYGKNDGMLDIYMEDN